jgi:hypothetical protein
MTVAARNLGRRLQLDGWEAVIPGRVEVPQQPTPPHPIPSAARRRWEAGMSEFLRSNAVALAVLFVALGGTGFAARGVSRPGAKGLRRGQRQPVAVTRREEVQTRADRGQLASSLRAATTSPSQYWACGPSRGP